MKHTQHTQIHMETACNRVECKYPAAFSLLLIFDNESCVFSLSAYPVTDNKFPQAVCPKREFCYHTFKRNLINNSKMSSG